MLSAVVFPTSYALHLSNLWFSLVCEGWLIFKAEFTHFFLGKQHYFEAVKPAIVRHNDVVLKRVRVCVMEESWLYSLLERIIFFRDLI